MTKPQLFEVIPDPPVKGGSFTVGYDFPDGVNSVEITVEFEPGGSTTHTITREGGAISLSAPDTADSVLITDTSDTSLPYHKGLANPDQDS